MRIPSSPSALMTAVSFNLGQENLRRCLGSWLSPRKRQRANFAFVVIAGQRCRQLMLGAPTRLAYPRSQQPTRVAMEESSAGLLEYRTPEIPGEEPTHSKRHKQ